MKFNKLIAKGLALGIILNSTSMLSYANTEIPNRYQTLEGEYITIDDSIEGNLEEIEIFGNTVQDENNLEDIQSVGDLYVDENGNPILDKQGRKQYKIDILSTGKNFLNIEIDGYEKSLDGKYYTSKYHGYCNYKNLQLIPNTKYVFSFTSNEAKANVAIKIGNSEEVKTTTYNNKTIKFTTDDTGIIWIKGGGDGYADIGVGPIDGFQIELGEIATSYTEYQGTNKTTILLPCQLQKVGYVADRLYWDSKKGRYVIEKNIKEFLYKDLNNNMNIQNIFNNTIHVSGKFKSPVALLNTGLILIEGFKKDVGIHNEGIDDSQLQECTTFVFSFRILKSNLNNYSDNDPDILEKVSEYMSSKKHILAVSDSYKEIIDTNITSKLKIPTYEEKTHIFIDSKNGINPTLRVMIDKLPQIAKNTVEEAEIDPSIENISLARMYINMLPESSYKEQLQNQLNDVFSSDMVLDRETTTSNLDVYIKSENILQMSLDTNSISFDDFSGIEDVVKENAVNITINSSLPYQINAYLPAEIQNSDKSTTMDKSILNIKESGEVDYKEFNNINEKVVLKDNCSSGNQLVHGIDIMLKGGVAHEKDVYKAVIKLEAEQK